MPTPLSDALLRVLAFDNPWLEHGDVAGSLQSRLPEPFIPRATTLAPGEGPGERACLVVGPRQVGKSTLVWKTLADTGRPALLLNCEEPAVREWLRSPASVLADLRDSRLEVDTLFFEEVQRLPDAGLFLKGLVDRRAGLRLFATGSSAFDLEAATRESLAGRADRHLLLPFSLEEILDWHGGGPIASRLEATRAVPRMLVYGSYPRVWLADDPDARLAALVEAFVIRDASDRFRIRHLAAFRKLLQLMASQIGNLCNFSEWAALAGISNDTVAEYAHLLEATHVIRLVRPFVGGKRAEITSAAKVYFLDNGVRNVLAGGFGDLPSRADRGALMEGFVFAELHKHVNPLLDSVRYWRSKSGAEVDFVLEHRGRLFACEVKAGDARGRLTRSARSFLAAYEPESLLVVSQTEAPSRREGPTEVHFVRPESMPGPLRAFLSR